MATTKKPKRFGGTRGARTPCGRAEAHTKASKHSPFHVVRRQAARILHKIIQGDVNRHAVASIKSLIYQPSVRNKKATMALTCQTLRYLPVINEVLENTNLLKTKGKVCTELLYITTFELLFGKELASSGGIENYVLSQKSSLRAALARLLVKRKVTCAEDLLPHDSGLGSEAVRYVRVNTLKMEVSEALELLGKSLEVKEDDMIPGLLTVAAGSDLYRHPLVLNGALILQGKASCIPALALAPNANWKVLDACAAPGNKTIQLAALMEGRGKVLACEINKNRLQRLCETVDIAGASNVEVLHEDFLKLDPSSLSLSTVKAILLDPSCSGSGTSHRRLDHLLPSSVNGQNLDAFDMQRLEKLACFQEKALRLALSFPGVERVVYSTCSIHQRENEDVIKSVLGDASRNNFRLGMPFPKWQQRGLPVFEGAHCLLRTEPSKHMDGFFVALFERSFQDHKVDTACVVSPVCPEQVNDKRGTSECFGNLDKDSRKRKRHKHKQESFSL